MFFLLTKGDLNSWVGLLYGSNMKNSDMNIVEFISATEYKLYDSFSTAHAPPSNDTDLGGTYDLKDIKYTMENGQGVVTCTRAYDTKDKFDTVVTPDKETTFTVAWGKEKLSYHSIKRKRINYYSISQDCEIDCFSF